MFCEILSCCLSNLINSVSKINNIILLTLSHFTTYPYEKINLYHNINHMLIGMPTQKHEYNMHQF